MGRLDKGLAGALGEVERDHEILAFYGRKRAFGTYKLFTSGFFYLVSEHS